MRSQREWQTIRRQIHPQKKVFWKNGSNGRRHKPWDRYTESNEPQAHSEDIRPLRRWQSSCSPPRTVSTHPEFGDSVILTPAIRGSSHSLWPTLLSSWLKISCFRVNGGQLFDLVGEDQVLTECQTVWFMRQILSAVKHLHDRSVVHLDLKPENILLSENKQIKLIDFGLSRVLEPTTQVKGFYGTPEFVGNYCLSRLPLTFYSPRHLRLQCSMWGNPPPPHQGVWYTFESSWIEEHISGGEETYWPKDIGNNKLRPSLV